MRPPSPPRIRLAVFVGAMALGAAALPARAEWLFDAGAGVAHDDNLTRAASAADKRADTAWTSTAAAGQYFALTDADGVTLSAFARGEFQRRYSDLDHIEIGVIAGWRHKFGLGWDAPFLALAGSASYDEYRDRLRTGERYEVHAELGQRFSERLDGAVGVAYDARNQRHDAPVLVPGYTGSMFDLRGQSAYAHAGFAIDDRWLVGARTAVRRRLVESTAQQGYAIFVTSDAIAEDRPFATTRCTRTGFTGRRTSRRRRRLTRFPIARRSTCPPPVS